MSEVELLDVSHSYGGQPALDNISVGFRKEKVTAVVGRSGSGKSTLLKTINGLVHPTHGQVRISGNPLDYNNIATQRHRIGYVVQGNGLFPHLTVSQNISMPGVITGSVSDIGLAPRALHLLRLVGLRDDHAEKYPHELSGGEQQRVAICRALFLDPPVLLMDEPFGALDAVTRKEINQQIFNFKNTMQLTIIIVTHDISEASRSADDILVLGHGKVQQFDTTDRVIQSPSNSIVTELLRAGLN